MSFLGKFKPFLSRRAIAFSFVILIIGIFLVVNPAHAAWWESVGNAVSFVVSAIMELYIGFVGKLLLLIIALLVKVAQYNNFLEQPAIVHAWVIIRDVCNMFFVVMMLVIAISTMLNYQKYHYKALLPKLIAAAILINFSRTIVGLIIDASQVVMMTFVSGFAAAAGGNFVEALQLTKIMNIDPGAGAVEGWQIAGAYLLGGLIVTLAIIVIFMMLLMLVARIIVLWILTALSPFAFMGMAFPGVSKYTDRWWNEFFKYVTIGPVLAFFIWLSLTIVGTGQENIATHMGQIAAMGDTEMQSAISQIGGEQSIFNFMIALTLLAVGAYAAKESGVAGGNMGMQAVNWAKQKGTGALKGAAAWTAKKPFQAIGAGLGAIDAKYKFREGMYGLVSRVPGFTKFGARKQAEVSLRREAKAEAAAKWVKHASPEALERLTKMRAWTPAEMAVKKEAERQAFASTDYWERRQKAEEQKWLKAETKRRGYKKVGDLIAANPNITKTATMTAKSNLQAEAANMLADFHVLGQQTHDRTVPAAASNFLKAHPDLINDIAIQKAAAATKNDLTIKFAQEHQFKTVISKLSDSDLMGLRPDQLTETVLKELSRKQHGVLKKVDVLKKVVIAWEMKQGPAEIVKQINTGKTEIDDLAKEQIEEKDLALEIAQKLEGKFFNQFLKLTKKKEAFKDTILGIKRDDKQRDAMTDKIGTLDARYNDPLRRGMERAVVAGAKFNETYEYGTDSSKPHEFATTAAKNTFAESIRNKDNTEIGEFILNIKAEDIESLDYNNELAQSLTINLDNTALKNLAARKKNITEQRTFEAVVKALKQKLTPVVDELAALGVRTEEQQSQWERNREVLNLISKARPFKDI